MAHYADIFHQYDSKSPRIICLADFVVKCFGVLRYKTFYERDKTFGGGGGYLGYLENTYPPTIPKFQEHVLEIWYLFLTDCAKIL